MHDVCPVAMGPEALYTAVGALAATVRHSFGPYGLDHVVRNEHGHIVITSHGTTLLAALDVSHPIAKLLVQAALGHAKRTGDGAIRIILGIEAGARAFMNAEASGGSPFTRAMILHLATDTAFDRAVEKAVNMRAHSFPACPRTMHAIVRGMFSGKVDPGVCKTLATGVAQILNGKEEHVLRTLRHPPILVLASPAPISASRVYPGLVLSQPFASPRMIVGASSSHRGEEETPHRFLVLTTELDPLAWGMGHLQGGNNKNNNKVLASRRDAMQELAELFADHVDLILSGPLLPCEFIDACLLATRSRRLLVVQNLGQEEMARIMATAGIVPWTRNDDATAWTDCVGTAGAVREQFVHDAPHVVMHSVQERSKAHFVTWVVCAPNRAFGEQVRGWIQRVLAVVQTSLEKKEESGSSLLRLCPGGLHVEMALMHALQDELFRASSPLARACWTLLLAMVRAPLDAASRASAAPLVARACHEDEAAQAHSLWANDPEEDGLILESAEATISRLLLMRNLLVQIGRMDALVPIRRRG